MFLTVCTMIFEMAYVPMSDYYACAERERERRRRRERKSLKKKCKITPARIEVKLK